MLLVQVISAQTADIHVNRLRAIDQLPVNAINSSFQDSEGYMWYGTVDGLCRDDGYNIHVFRSDFITPGLMEINSVLSIDEDQRGRIWFGTHKGVYILDKTDYHIEPLGRQELQKPIYRLLSTKDGSIWIETDRCLHQFGSDSKLKQTYRLQSDVLFLFADSKGNLFYGLYGNGLYYKSASNKDFRKIASFVSPTCMAEDVDGKGYWIGELDGSLSHFFFSEKTNVKQVERVFSFNSTADRAIGLRSIVEDNTTHHLWLITSEGLKVLKVDENKQSAHIVPDVVPSGRMLLSHIFKTRDGRILVSGFDTESFYISTTAKDIREFPMQPLINYTHYQPAIVTLCRDEGGIFWYYQENNGLFIYDVLRKQVVSYRDCPLVRELPLNIIPYLVKSHDKNCVWVSTPDTYVMKLRREGMQMIPVKTINLADTSPSSGGLEVIYEDAQGNLWMGTMNGVFVYEVSKGNVKKISEEIGDVSDFTQTQDGRIWCTVRNKGICCIEQSGHYQLYPYNMDFLTLDATSDGILWVSTGEGQVVTFDSSKPSVIAHDYTEAAGLSGDMVDHVKIDRYNHIWIVTPQNIREFNPRNNALRVYPTSDVDVPLRRFLPRAVWCDPAGQEIFFGGIPGLISLQASQRLESIPRNTHVKITDVKIAGKTIWLNGNYKKTSESIEIRPGDDHLSLEFSSLDFQHLSHIRYAYRLQGIDEDWVYLPVGENRAVYNKLPRGKYVFEVRSTDENGLWSNSVTSFYVHRLPAWYETWWARMFYLLAICCLIYILMRAYQQRLKEKNHQLLLEEVTQTKLRYFTNISHELLTPLTIISVIADRMKKESEKRKQEDKTAALVEADSIGMIKGNVAHLKRLLQQVLDFRKIESNKMNLYVQQGHIMDFLENICRTSFYPLAESRGIQLQLSLEPSSNEDWFDHDKFEKVVFNLLSNALKYTDDGGYVSLNGVTERADGHRYAVITVADKGRGIAADQLENIFNRFYSSARNDAAESNGIGLSLTKEFVELHHGSIRVDSRLGKGTSFIVRIPIDRESFNMDELKEERQEEQRQMMSQQNGIHSSSNVSPVSPDAATILLVEDNRELLLLMQEMLKDSYHVFIAMDGIEAFEVISQHRDEIDMVVSDIRMPRMDGLELCKRIKEDIATSHYIVVLLTARVSSEVQVESYDAGADGYLSKPFETNLLTSLLSNLWRGRQQRQQHYVQTPTEVRVSDLGVSKIDESFISHAVSIVEEHLDSERLDVNFLASELAMSRSTFARKIKAITGQTPLDFIKNIKMKHAYQLLLNKTATVQDVMAAIGYQDHKTFTQSFRDAFGILPSDVIKQQRSSSELS